MADNKHLHKARDRSRVAGSQDYEPDYLAEKTGVSREQVKAAITAVVSERDKVTAHLQQCNGRPS